MTMSSRLILALLALLVAACGAPQAEETPREARQVPGTEQEQPTFDGFETAARASTNRLQLDLKQELSAAMKTDGPVGALEVCSTRAAELTAEVSEQTGLEVRRVSLRHRNPANEATPGEASVLALMAARPDLADTMIVRDGAPLYMRAIRINTPVCLNCHGARDELDPGVVAALDDLYADDRATGFAKGDLRGAFVVRPLEN